MLDRSEAISTAAYHARRRGVTQVVYSRPYTGLDAKEGDRFYWFSSVNLPPPSDQGPDVRLEYITH